MLERNNAGERPMRKEFVAYNLVFGPSSNGLPVITASLLSEAMGDRGYEMSAEEAEGLLGRWAGYGKLRHRGHRGQEMEYAVN